MTNHRRVSLVLLPMITLLLHHIFMMNEFKSDIGISLCFSKYKVWPCWTIQSLERLKNKKQKYFLLKKETKNFVSYRKYDTIAEVKKPTLFTFKSVRKRVLKHSEFLSNDFSNFGHPLLAHLAFQVLDVFVHTYGCFSNTISKGNAGGLIDLTNALVSSMWDDENLYASDMNVLNHFSNGLYEILNPIIAILW